MRLRFWLKLGGVLHLIAAYFLFGQTDSICWPEEGLPQKSEIANYLREYLSSIETIQVRFKISQGRQNATGTSGAESELRSFEWVEQGRQKLMRMEGSTSESARMEPLFISHDGQAAYYVDYDPVDQQKIRTVRRTSEINFGFHATQTPALMCGMRVPGLEGTLCDLLTTDLTKIIGIEELFSARCLHIAVPEYVGLGGFRTAIDAWLDIERDYLPRRIVFKITDESPAIVARVRNLPNRFETPELQQVPDQLLGRSRWFPQVITIADFSGSRRISVDSVAINHHLSNSFFLPTMPIGTLIIEGEDRPFEKSRPMTVVGGSKATTLLVDQRLQNAAKLRTPDAPRGFVNANNKLEWNWSLWVSVVCLFVLSGVGARNLWFRA